MYKSVQHFCQNSTTVSQKIESILILLVEQCSEYLTVNFLKYMNYLSNDHSQTITDWLKMTMHTTDL